MQTYSHNSSLQIAGKAGLILAGALVVQGLAAVLDRWLGWGITHALLPVTCGIGGLAVVVLIGCLIQLAFNRR